MSDDDKTVNPSTETGTENQPTAPTNEPVDLAALQAELEKWKHFSRDNESKKNEALKKLDELQRSQMSDAEKALAEARDAGVKEGTSKVAQRLVKAEIKAAAASAGVEVPDGLDRVLNFDNLVKDDGEPDEEAITTLVSSFKPSSNQRNAFAQGLGIGPQGGGEPTIDYSPQAIAERVFKRTSY